MEPPDVPTEWWFLIGTLKSADKTFGFEVNIPRFGNILAQSWVMISDVDADEHYQQVLTYPMSHAQNLGDRIPGGDAERQDVRTARQHDGRRHAP